MRRQMRMWAVGLLLGLAGCTPYQVNYDYDVRAPFKGYKTFDWLAAPRWAKERAQKVENAFMEHRVRAIVERELVAKGFKLEATGQPDFLVTYYPVYQRKAYVTTTGYGWGYGWGHPYWGGGMSGSVSQVHPYTEGTIVLEIVDAKTDQMVWTSSAAGALTNLSSPAEAEEVIGNAVKDMLYEFPPKR